MNSRAPSRSSTARFGLALLLLFGAAIGPLYAGDPNPKLPTPVIEKAMNSVVMVMSVDLVNGQLRPVSSGSGTIVHENGMLITNTHVIYDSVRGRRHDLFIIGRFRGIGQPPEFICAGLAANAEVVPDIDIARLQCDRDRSGNAWQSSSWPHIALPDSLGQRPIVGESVWVLGYPLTTMNSLQVAAGRTTAWLDQEPTRISDIYSKTDAHFGHGVSGGALINAKGELIGVPSAFRLRTSKKQGALVSAGRIGLIRPLHVFRNLLLPSLGPHGK